MGFQLSIGLRDEERLCVCDLIFRIAARIHYLLGSAEVIVDGYV